MSKFAESLQREPLYRQIYQQLEESIVGGDLEVGDTLPSETELSENYGVHRSSVREALRLLEENGLVSRKLGKKKLIVTTPNREKMSQRLTNSMVMEEVTMNEIYRAGQVLESMVAEMAAQNITPEILQRIRLNIEQTAKYLEVPSRVRELDHEFHELLAEATGNRVLQWCRLGMRGLYYPMEHEVFSKVSASSKRLLEAHTQILFALEKGDTEKAKEWAWKHTKDFERACDLLGVDMNDRVKWAKVE